MSKKILYKTLILNLEQLYNTGAINLKFYKEVEAIINKGLPVTMLYKFSKLYEHILSLPKSVNLDGFLESFNDLYKDKYDMLVPTPTNITNSNSYLSLRATSLAKLKNIAISSCQEIAIDKIINFLKGPDNVFGLFGYAGTGKTKLLIEILTFLLDGRYIYNVCLSAPTNKAVDVIKMNFAKPVDNLTTKFLGIDNIDEDFTKQLELLQTKNISINFLTIHKLLGYQETLDNEGNVSFTKKEGNKTQIDKYNVIIIDECSMLPINVITDIFQDLEDVTNKGSGLGSVNTKIIFMGDPAQLPPVGEPASYIFNTNFEQFDDNLIKKTLQEKILSIERFTMTNIVRTDNSQIKDLSNECRLWIDGLIKPIVKFTRFKDPNIFCYRHDGKSKINSLWFKKFLLCVNDLTHDNNIILTWTNSQAKLYNDTIRKYLNNVKNKDKDITIINGELGNQINIMSQHIKGDRIIMNDYYFCPEGKNKLYTCEQLIIIDIKETSRINQYLPSELGMIKNNNLRQDIINPLSSRYKTLIEKINSRIITNIPIYRLTTNKLINGKCATDSNCDTEYILYVPKLSFTNILNKNFYVVKLFINDFNNFVSSKFKDQKKIDYVNEHIMVPLWTSIKNIFVKPYANFSISFATTTYKSQSSTYANVFVDIDNILLSDDLECAQKSIYTAITRTSRQLHLLI